MRETEAKLVIRNATLADVPAIVALSRRVYAKEISYTEAQVRGQINNFPEGAFVAEYEGAVAGYCSTMVVPEDLAMRPHSWAEITGGGFVATGPDDEAVHKIREWVRYRVGFYGSTPAYYPVLAAHGLEDLGLKLENVTLSDLGGCKTVIIDKDNAPNWQPARLEDLSDAAIDAYFAPLADELDLEGLDRS